jgi:hypothetical protein
MLGVSMRLKPSLFGFMCLWRCCDVAHTWPVPACATSPFLDDWSQNSCVWLCGTSIPAASHSVAFLSTYQGATTTEMVGSLIVTRCIIYTQFCGYYLHGHLTLLPDPHNRPTSFMPSLSKRNPQANENVDTNQALYTFLALTTLQGIGSGLGVII